MAKNKKEKGKGKTDQQHTKPIQRYPEMEVVPAPLLAPALILLLENRITLY